LAEFDRLSIEYNFETVDASPDARIVFSLLKSRISEVLATTSHRPSIPILESAAERFAASREISAASAFGDHGSRDVELLLRPFTAARNGNSNNHTHVSGD